MQKQEVDVHLGSVRSTISDRIAHRAVADLRGDAGDAHPPRGPNSFNFMKFWENFGKIIYWLPPWGVGAPSSGKSWIRHCREKLKCLLRKPSQEWTVDGAGRGGVV